MGVAAAAATEAEVERPKVLAGEGEYMLGALVRIEVGRSITAKMLQRLEQIFRG